MKMFAVLKTYLRWAWNPSSENACCLIIELAEFLDARVEKQMSDYLSALHTAEKPEP